jgi:hypothetical protein
VTRGVLPAVILISLLMLTPAAAAASPVGVTVGPDQSEVSTVLGGRFTLKTEMTNTGNVPTGALLAHLNVASVQGDVYVDPEDWSPARSQEFSLQPGESRTLSWEIQAVNSGKFAAYVVVLPFGDDVAGEEELAVSPLVRLDVAPRSTVSAGVALPLVVSIPLALGATATVTLIRARRRT